MPLPIRVTNDDGGNADHRMSAEQAGYMELQGARKDADCRKVNVPGGVSKELGCCNEFEPQDDSVQEFECGQCEYLVNNQPGGNNVQSGTSESKTSIPAPL